MTSARPYREPLSIGEALSEIVRLAPLKYDPDAVQALLTQVRRSASGSLRSPFFDERMIVDIAPTDVDQLASSLQHKLSHNRIYLT
jgi:HD-GYP domain-containing protein (c-di-GMP phosphodiesterase class II)